MPEQYSIQLLTRPCSVFISPQSTIFYLKLADFPVSCTAFSTCMCTLIHGAILREIEWASSIDEEEEEIEEEEEDKEKEDQQEQETRTRTRIWRRRRRRRRRRMVCISASFKNFMNIHRQLFDKFC